MGQPPGVSKFDIVNLYMIEDAPCMSFAPELCCPREGQYRGQLLFKLTKKFGDL